MNNSTSAKGTQQAIQKVEQLQSSLSLLMLSNYNISSGGASNSLEIQSVSFTSELVRISLSLITLPNKVSNFSKVDNETTVYTKISIPIPSSSNKLILDFP